ncbi:MAG: tetratricopeptide repeat protein [Acidobacteriota bacterium]
MDTTSTRPYLIVGIVLAGLATYANSLHGPFVLDDLLSVVYNDDIREGRHIWSVLFSSNQDTSVAGRPLAHLSFAANYALGGLDVRGYHVWNIAVHVACALLVFGVVRLTLERPRLAPIVGSHAVSLAFASALIWELHPLNSEVVDYLTQRTESMMALFYFLTMYASARGLASGGAGRWEWLSVASCAVGMTCKESMATAPAMVVLYDWIFGFASLRDALRTRWRLYVGLAATWAIVVWLTWSGSRSASAGFATDVHPWTYLLNQTIMITRYLRQAVWPSSLVVFYGWPAPLGLSDVLAPAVFLVALLVLTVVALARWPALGFVGAFFFGTLAPTSSIVPIATEVGAERRMYIPLTVLVVLAVISARVVWNRVERLRSPDTQRAVVWRVVPLAVLGIVIVGLAAATMARNREYRSNLALLHTVVERWPTSPAEHMLGAALVDSGEHEAGLVHLRAATVGAPRAYLDLGVELFKDGKLDEAVSSLQSLIRIWASPPAVHPHWQAPLRDEVVSARKIMGRAFARQGRWEEANTQFQEALAMSPADADVRALIGDAFFGLHAFDDAIRYYRAHLGARPNDVLALGGLGMALAVTGRFDEAAGVFRRVIELKPDDGLTERHLANVLLDGGHITEAGVHAERAVALVPDDPAAHDVLGRALGRQGRFAESAAHFEQSLRIDPDYADAREHLERVRPFVRQ